MNLAVETTPRQTRIVMKPLDGDFFSENHTLRKTDVRNVLKGKKRVKMWPFEGKF